MAVEYNGKIYSGMKDIAEEKFSKGEPFDAVEHTNYGKGTRPYAISGWRVVVEGGKVQLWRYGPKHHDPPSGNARYLVQEREAP